MKELHFYSQGILCLLALAIAVQIPENADLIGYLALIQVVLGAYQYGMSWFLITRLERDTSLLNNYFLAVKGYFILLIGCGLLGKLNDQQWLFVLYVLPWVFAIFFLVIMEDLLWKYSIRVVAKEDIPGKKDSF